MVTSTYYTNYSNDERVTLKLVFLFKKRIKKIIYNFDRCVTV
jgi:hypothetical protein